MGLGQAFAFPRQGGGLDTVVFVEPSLRVRTIACAARHPRRPTLAGGDPPLAERAPQSPSALPATTPDQLADTPQKVQTLFMNDSPPVGELRASLGKICYDFYEAHRLCRAE